jgi:hypothetical protein
MGTDTDPFATTLAIAAKRADRLPTDDLAKTIILGLSSLQATGNAFRVPGYQAVYEASPLETFNDFSTRAEGIYQQIHALSESVARLVGKSATPPLVASNVGALADRATTENHPLAPELSLRAREIELLRWLGTVRNKAVQHRAQNGYTDNKAIVLKDGFVLARKPSPPTRDAVRKARGALVGLVRQFDVALDTSTGPHETLAYLDLVSHGIFRAHPARADPARRIVRDAAVHYIVVSSAVLNNVAWALGRLLELAPEHPRGPGAGAANV